MSIALFLSAASALIAVLIASARVEGDAPTGLQIIGTILFFPNVFLSLGCLWFAIVKLRVRENRVKAIIILILSLVMPVGLVFRSCASHREERTEAPVSPQQAEVLITTQAPETGYSTNFEINMPASSTNWNSQADQKFYYRTADGRYGRMAFSMIAGGQHFFMVDSVLNPTGSRNLGPAN